MSPAATAPPIATAFFQNGRFVVASRRFGAADWSASEEVWLLRVVARVCDVFLALVRDWSRLLYGIQVREICAEGQAQSLPNEPGGGQAGGQEDLLGRSPGQMRGAVTRIELAPSAGEVRRQARTGAGGRLAERNVVSPIAEASPPSVVESPTGSRDARQAHTAAARTIASSGILAGRRP
jgi:hypothetical protein